MNRGTTSKTAAHMVGVSNKRRSATSGNKRILRSGKGQMSATSQGARVRSTVKRALVGPFYV